MVKGISASGILRTVVAAAACAAVSTAFLYPTPIVRADEGTTDVLKLQLEVDALSTLDDLHLTPSQLSDLQTLAADSAAPMPTGTMNVSAARATALQNLKTALLGGNEDTIGDAQDKVSNLEDEDTNGPDEPDIEPTDAAKGKLSQTMKLLTPPQVAAYISANSDDVPDPGAILVDALNQCHDLSKEDFTSLKEDTTQQLGELAGGMSPTKTPAIIGKAGKFLDTARALTADDFKTQLPSLQDQARKLGATVDPVNCIRHWMEGDLADLLSNPQLGQALTDRGVVPKSAEDAAPAQ
jgi:hypothetical protein